MFFFPQQVCRRLQYAKKWCHILHTWLMVMCSLYIPLLIFWIWRLFEWVVHEFRQFCSTFHNSLKASSSSCFALLSSSSLLWCSWVISFAVDTRLCWVRFQRWFQLWEPFGEYVSDCSLFSSDQIRQKHAADSWITQQRSNGPDVAKNLK